MQNGPMNLLVPFHVVDFFKIENIFWGVYLQNAVTNYFFKTFRKMQITVMVCIHICTVGFFDMSSKRSDRVHSHWQIWLSNLCTLDQNRRNKSRILRVANEILNNAFCREILILSCLIFISKSNICTQKKK